jgi:hypothetical protein
VLANAITALRGAPEWQGVLWHDAFATTTVARKPPPWIGRPQAWSDTPWADRDDALVADWLQHQDIMVPMSVAGQAVEVVARDRIFHPVREYLDGLSWDGTPRLEAWLLRYLGAEDNAYHRAVGPRWLISAVARIYVPGCKADCALILEGPQGIRKSSALMALAAPWFTDRLSDPSSKDAAMETRGVWIIEIAELDTMGRAEGIQDPGEHTAAFVYWMVPDNGGHYAEFWTELDIVARVWVPLKTDWLPFRTKHAMPFLQAHASLAMVNHLKRKERLASCEASTPTRNNGLPPWLVAAKSQRQAARASADGEPR